LSAGGVGLDAQIARARVFGAAVALDSDQTGVPGLGGRIPQKRPKRPCRARDEGAGACCATCHLSPYHFHFAFRTANRFPLRLECDRALQSRW
jgi:hypothetical protein